MNKYNPARVALGRLPTPIERLEKLSKRYKKNIWIKRDDLSETALSGNKVRKLEYIVAEALENKADVLVTWGAVQSNHCRATAIAAAKLGMKSHLVLRGSEPNEADGNLLIDKLVNSRISYQTPDEYGKMDETYELLQTQYEKEGKKTFRIPVGGSNETGLWGYINCARELVSDFKNIGFNPEAIVCATGSGGTQGGLILGADLHQIDGQIFGINVCDNKRYFENKIGEDINLWSEKYSPATSKATQLQINIIEGYVGAGYGKASAEIFETIREVAELEGILLDPVYTGKAFHGMISEIENGCFARFQDILFIHTGGIFGIFPHKENMV